MFVRVNCEILTKSLSNMIGIVERKTTVPSLSCVLINAEDGELKISGTNFEMSIQEVIPVDDFKNDEKDTLIIDTEGSCVVPVHTIHSILRKIPKDVLVKLSYDAGKGQLGLHAEGINYNISALPAEEYPTIEDNTLPYTFNLDIQEFLNAANVVSIAMGNDEARKFLGGIFFHVANNKELRLVSTDAHRLVRYSLSMARGAENIPGIIFSGKMIHELLRILPKYTGTMELSISESLVRFNFSSIVLNARLLDGAYPNYEAAIPDYQCNDKEAIVATSSMKAALERSLIMLDDVPEANKIMKVDFASDQMTIKIDTNTSKGSGTEIVKINYNGNPIVCGYNAKFFLEILQYIKSKEIEIKLQDNSSPMLIFDTENSRVLYLLMPTEVAA